MTITNNGNEIVAYPYNFDDKTSWAEDLNKICKLTEIRYNTWKSWYEESKEEYKGFYFTDRGNFKLNYTPWYEEYVGITNINSGIEIEL